MIHAPVFLCLTGMRMWQEGQAGSVIAAAERQLRQIDSAQLSGVLAADAPLEQAMHAAHLLTLGRHPSHTHATDASPSQFYVTRRHCCCPHSRRRSCRSIR